MRELEKKIKFMMEKNPIDSQLAALRIKDYIMKSYAVYKGISVKTLMIPKVFERNDIEIFRQLTNTTSVIFDKVMKAYRNNPDFRALFPFSDRMRRLIDMETGYTTEIPMVRMDIFYNEETGDFKFCEFNTDGTSAMIEDYELNRALQYHNCKSLLEHCVSFELFDTWVKEVEEIYSQMKQRVDKPRVAVVDFLDKAYVSEFGEFVRRFEKYGYEAVICDIRKLTYDGEHLYTEDGKQIDIIYRRAVTCDILEQYDSILPFVQAVKEQKVCLIGGFKTQIVHHKALFFILHNELTKTILTPEENAFISAHVPYTCLLDDMEKQALEHKDKWIIKPMDSYGSRGVFAGYDYSNKEWKQLVEKSLHKGYIIQEYFKPFQTDNIDYTTEEPRHEFMPYSNLTGLYVYNRKFCGIYSRMSDGGIISSQYNEKAVATLVALPEQEFEAE